MLIMLVGAPIKKNEGGSPHCIGLSIVVNVSILKMLSGWSKQLASIIPGLVPDMLKCEAASEVELLQLILYLVDISLYEMTSVELMISIKYSNYYYSKYYLLLISQLSHIKNSN